MAEEVTLVEAPPPAAPPAPTTELHVTPQTIDHGPQPDVPRPGSARARMLEDLRKKAKDPEELAPAAPKAATPPPKATPPKPGEKPTTPTPEEKPIEAEAPKTADVPKPEEKPLSPEERKKVNPWKLVDQYKEQTTKLQKEISDLRTSALPEKERTELQSRIEKAEARAKALEEHIQFLDYSKSQEFQDKYQKPYEEAWTRAMGELGELTVNDGEGNARPIQAQDILDLVNLPLPKAREMAESLYGPFANDVMGHRKEIRNLFEAQAKALEDARKNGAERIKQTVEQQTKQMGEIKKFIGENWEAANQSIVRDEKYGLYFTPVEGDENINQRLAKGAQLVDRAFAENPADPKLTPDERRAVIKRHAAVRNRAIAFGRLVYELDKAKADMASLREELKKYRGSEPTTTGTPKPENGGEPAPTSAKESVFAALRAKAR